jgi:putative membrane protein
MSVDKYFSGEDIKRIEKAVGEAEKKTEGEIVVSLAYDSDPYSEVPYRSGLLVMIISWLFLLLCGLFSLNISLGSFIRSWASRSSFFMTSELPVILLVSVLAFGLGWSVVLLFPGLRRFLLSERRQTEEVRQSALEIFHNENCHLTEKHSGILIYLTLFERRVEIIADKGINDAVGDPLVWNEIVGTLAGDIRRGKPAEGMVKAVERCGEILKEKFPGSGKGKNELSDGVRIRN